MEPIKRLALKLSPILTLSLLAGAWVALLCFDTPLTSDDTCMATFGHNLSELGAFLGNYYLTWGGRLVAHTFVFLFASSPKWMFDVANGAAFATLILFLWRLIIGPESKNQGPSHPCIAWVFPAILTLFVLTQPPKFGESFIWLSGSGNYLWTFLFQLAFLICYRDWYFNVPGVANKGKPFVAFMGVVGLLAGCTNENTAPATWGFALLMVLDVLLFQKRKLEAWVVTGLAAQFVGILVLVLAPGNKVRLADPHVIAAASVGAAQRVSNYWEHIKDYLFTPWPMLIVACLFFAFLLKRGLKPTLLAKPNTAFMPLHNRFTLYLGAAAVASIALLLLAPYVEQRAITGGTLFLAAGATKGLMRLRVLSPKVIKPAMAVTLGALSLLAIYFMVPATLNYATLHRQAKLVATEIAACQAAQVTYPNLTCMVTPYNVPATRYQFVPLIAQLQPDPKDVYNVCIAKRYGLSAFAARY